MKIPFYKLRMRFLLNVMQEEYNNAPYGKGDLYLSMHSRAASENNETYFIFLPSLHKKLPLRFLKCHTSAHTMPYFCLGKCKLMQLFHLQDIFSFSLHSPCQLFLLSCSVSPNTKHCLWCRSLFNVVEFSSKYFPVL